MTKQMTIPERVEHLKKCLVELEEQTGRRIRRVSRCHEDSFPNSFVEKDCPFENFAPDKDKYGCNFREVTSGGYIRYEHPTEFIAKEYKAYSHAESNRWYMTTNDLKEEIFDAICEWNKTHKKGQL